MDKTIAFVGYLPQDAGQERTQRIKELEGTRALRHGPDPAVHRDARTATPALWQALVQTLQPHTRLALASGLTLPERAGRKASWCASGMQQPAPPDNRTPVVFALGR